MTSSAVARIESYLWEHVVLVGVFEHDIWKGER